MARSTSARRANLLVIAAFFLLSLLSTIHAQTSFSLPAPIASSTATSSAATPSSTAGAGTGTGNSTAHAASACPAMFIPNTKNLTIPTCANGCCIPCPAVNSFYEPGAIESVMTDARLTRYVSFGLDAFMVLSFSILPGKREQPFLTILFVAASEAMLNVAFEVIKYDDQCMDEFQMQTAKSSTRCSIQSFGVIYFAQAVTLWVALLIVKLHLLAVWHANPIDRHFKKLAFGIFLLPLCFAIPPTVMGLAQNPGIGSACITDTSVINQYLFYPLAVYMYPAMMMHFVTVAKMIQISVMSSHDKTEMSQLSGSNQGQTRTQLKNVVKAQWRPALMLGIIATTVTVFWLFYFIDAHKLATLTPATPWFQEWVGCLIAQSLQGKSVNDAQTICAKMVEDDVPSLVWFRAAEMILAIIGIVIFVVFASKGEFWSDWGDMLISLFTRGKTTNTGRGRSPNGTLSPSLSQRQNAGSRMGGGGPVQQHQQQHHQAKMGDDNQWYAMDDFMDKDIKSTTELNRSQSYGSRTGMVTNGANHEPPYYNDGGDILYSPPQHEQDYHQAQQRIDPYDGHNLVADSGTGYDQYVGQPVVPAPVPRTPKMQSKAAVYLSNPEDLNMPTSPTLSYAPSSRQHGSLSPMPSKGYGSHHQQQQLTQSFHDSGRSGSPLPAYATPTMESVNQGRAFILQPAPPISADLQNSYYYPSHQGGDNNSGDDRIMRASNGSRQQGQQKPYRN